MPAGPPEPSTELVKTGGAKVGDAPAPPGSGAGGAEKELFLPQGKVSG